jgi:phosphotransferase system HPr (HPr) family protein
MKATYRVVNKKGIGAREASLLVSVFNRFDNLEISVIYPEESTTAEGKSILSLLSLLVPEGEIIIINAEGDDSVKMFELLDHTLETHKPEVLSKVQ